MFKAFVRAKKFEKSYQDFRFCSLFLEVMCLSEARTKGKMTVAEAGRMGGLKTSETYGPKFYSEIGSKGGQKVRKLVKEGKEHEEDRW
jgi:general stress protein YciG